MGAKSVVAKNFFRDGRARTLSPGSKFANAVKEISEKHANELKKLGVLFKEDAEDHHDEVKQSTEVPRKSRKTRKSLHVRVAESPEKVVIEGEKPKSKKSKESTKKNLRKSQADLTKSINSAVPETTTRPSSEHHRSDSSDSSDD